MMIEVGIHPGKHKSSQIFQQGEFYKELVKQVLENRNILGNMRSPRNLDYRELQLGDQREEVREA
jgi:hypothetical protein